MTDSAFDKILTGPITGNAKADLMLRYGFASVGGGIVLYAAGWAKAHGYKIPDADQLKIAGQVVAGLLIIGYATMLGLKSNTQNEKVVVANAIQAAITGQVPEAIAAKATPAQAAAIEASPTATVTTIAPAKAA